MKERHAKRRVLANPDEPRAGDFQYSLYDKAHPVHGDPDTIARLKKELRGLRGEKVTVVFKGAHVDEEGTAHRFRLQRTFNYRQYGDMFGPGSAYADAVHFIRDKYSNEELVTYSFDVEVADDDDENEEEAA